MAPADTASDTAPASATPAAGLTVIIGTRDAAALADAVAAGRSAARTVIALPEPGAAALLEARLAGRADVQLIAAAIGRPPGGGDGAGGDGGEAPLLVFNAPGLVSLRPPTGLAALMPGLRVVARPRVPVIAPAALLARIGPVARPFRLVIDAPGAEGEILEALAAAGLAGALDRLEVHCGAAPLVEGAWGRAAVEAWAATQGFARIALDLADPDFPALTFAPDRLRRELAEAQAQMQAQGRALAEARAQAEAQGKALAEARAQAEAQGKALAEAQAATLAAQTEAHGLRRRLDAALRDCRRLEDGQKRMRDELLSAEGQVRLLSDLLLRDAEL
ncbi:MAG: hypothetical protein ACK4OP_00990 [Gemmobacter sp.]